jgi:hypothetical protein
MRDHRSIAGRWLVIGFAALAVMLASPHHAQALLVTNGGFEDDSDFFNSFPFVGWTPGGGTVDTTLVTLPVNSGFYAASMGLNSSDESFSQNIPTTPSASYTLAFFLQPYNGDDTPPSGASFQVFWDGNLLQTITLADLTAFTFTQFTYNVSATGASTPLEFVYNYPDAHLILDDVSVTSTAVSGPASLVLVGTGLVGLAGAGWRRRRQA